jgi:hypothetical protein
MNYFKPYLLPPDETIVAAWDSQIAEAAEIPWLASALKAQGVDLFPRFAACYARLRVMPRGARRAFQSQLARSHELAAVLPDWARGAAGLAFQRRLARTLAGAALLLALSEGVGQAAIINVTTNIPGISPDGNCSLIEAIINANNDTATHSDCTAGSGADTIVLPAGTQTLTAVYGNTYGPTGLPLITSQITIQGNGAKIVRSKKGPQFRLMAVSATGNLTLDHVTLSGGASTVDGGSAVINYGTLTVSNSIISGNTAYNGGGIANYNGTATITDSTISKNTANQIIHVGSYNVGGYGGGVFNSGTLTISNSTLTGNKAYEGGGMYNSGTATITNSMISSNSATPYKHCTTTKPKHCYLYGGSGAGVLNYLGDLTVTDSTISGNKANSGGGLFNYSGNLTVQNSTISKNSAKFYGGGIYDHGPLTQSGNSFSKNKAKFGPDIYYAP